MKKLLVTGATGFLGSIIVEHLCDDYEVISLGRNTRNAIVTDLAKEVCNLPQIDFVVHAAGKAHSIPKTEKEKKEFFDVNVSGTINLVNSLDKLDILPKSVVLISTVAVYGLERGKNINENYPTKASTPYAVSKRKSEVILEDWGNKNDVKVCILRLPLVVGDSPKGNLKKMIESIKSGKYFSIGEGKAHKSMVLARDVASIMSNALIIRGVYNLTDGHHPTFRSIEKVISDSYHKKLRFLPFWFVKILALPSNIFSFWPLNSHMVMKITSSLTFDDQKARKILGWKPNKVIDYLPKIL